jgi:hypothetical protein
VADLDRFDGYTVRPARLRAAAVNLVAAFQVAAWITCFVGVIMFVARPGGLGLRIWFTSFTVALVIHFFRGHRLD